MDDIGGFPLTEANIYTDDKKAEIPMNGRKIYESVNFQN